MVINFRLAVQEIYFRWNNIYLFPMHLAWYVMAPNIRDYNQLCFKVEELCQKCTMQRWMAAARKISTERNETVPDMKVKLRFERFNKMIRRCMLMMMDIDLETWYITELVKYGRRVQKMLLADIYWSSHDEENIFVLPTYCKKGNGEQWVVKLLLLFTMSVRWSNKNQQ